MTLVFRKIVLATFLSYLVLLTLPYLWSSMYSEEIMNALSWWGYGGVLDIYGYIPYIFVFSSLASLIGLYFFKSWSRKLFLVTAVTSAIISPLWGLNIVPNIDAIFAHVYGLGSGAILAMSYLSEVRNRFEEDT